MVKDKKITELRKELRELRKRDEQIQDKINELNTLRPDTWQIEKQIYDLSHRFRERDWVVLQTKQIAHIRERIGDSKYKVFKPVLELKGFLGTNHTIHEKDILCHVAGLDLRDVKFKCSPDKWSKRPKDNP